ncbi:MAG: CtsR family transcriptional regulator [Clostridia bacterium]|jgi:transcriptional regulator CtsR|nr:CtsR family transcriptional regulator [Clostridia bacterium]
MNKSKQAKRTDKGSDEMRISDLIEDFIKDMLKTEDELEIQRNELAEQFNCVPSQINYVISTRFKPSQGYYVESRRGGGGHITIKKINITQSNYLMHIITSIGDNLTSKEVDIFISNFLSDGIVTKKEAKLLKVATSDNVLNVPIEIKDMLRARIFKNMLINLVED